jgi:hypothetical protein
MRALLPLVVALSASACGTDTISSPVAADAQDNASTPRGNRISPPAAVEEMKRKLLAEPAVLDLMYDPDAAVQWQVGASDDGSRRHGLAETICMDLKEAGLVDKRTSVRIVDLAKLNANSGDFRAASLGRVDCNTFEHFAV